MSITEKREKLLEKIHESIPCLEQITNTELLYFSQYEDLIDEGEYILNEADNNTIEYYYAYWFEDDDEE